MLTRFSAPLAVYLNVTNACNLTCSYCSADSGNSYPDELSLQEIFKLIDDLSRLKVFKVTVTGGEPFLRKDIFDIFQKLVGAGIQASLITNGTLVTDEVSLRLRELGVDSVNVSLDSTSAEANDAVRGRRAFERAYRGIHTFLRNGIRPMILVTVTRHNFAQVEEITEELKNLEVQAVAFNLVAPVGRGGCTYPLLTLSQEELGQFSETLRAAKTEGGSFVKEDFLHWYALPRSLERYVQAHGDRLSERARTLLPCGAAKTSCSVTADGWVIPCNKFTGYRCGNIRHKSFLEIWQGVEMESLRSLAQKPTADAEGCSNCKYNVVCSGGCRADAYLHFNSLEAPDPNCGVLADSAVHTYRQDTGLLQIGMPRKRGTAATELRPLRG